MSSSSESRLHKGDFVDWESFHYRTDTAALEEGLDTFLRIYVVDDRIRHYMQSDMFKYLNDSSKTFLKAIQFLRDFKINFYPLYISDKECRQRLLEEVAGLMSSILQVIMNANKLSESNKTYLREIFFGTTMRGGLIGHKSLAEDFVYEFPKLFLDVDKISGNWFTPDNSSEITIFSSSEVQNEARQLVTGCLVNLYESHLKARFGSAYHNAAVEKLEETGAQAHSESLSEDSVSEDPVSEDLSFEGRLPTLAAIRCISL